MRPPPSPLFPYTTLFRSCLLSGVQGTLYQTGFDHTPGRLDLANAAVQTALHLQPDAGEAHLALAIYYYYGFRDYRRARSEDRKSTRLNSSHTVISYAVFC